MTRRILLIDAHPRAGSLNDALAEAYSEGARAAGAELRRLTLRNLDFELQLRSASPRQQALEPDLRTAWADLLWAQHLVLVFPTWWGTMPALLKGFLDRVLLPDAAFRERPDNQGFEGLLQDRSAELITTMDTPPWVYRWIYRAPGIRAVADATLGFCGIRVRSARVLGPVKGSSPQQRAQWLAGVRTQAEHSARAGVPALRRALDKCGAWLRALRLQFHPMVWAAYALGAVAAQGAWQQVEPRAFWLGLLAMFLLEAAAIFTNERCDFETDRRNRHYGPFTGGARVLVDGSLTRRELRIGTWIAGTLAAVAAVTALHAHPLLLAGFLVAGVLAIGYTLPPLKLSWRGLGELDVAITHSLLPILLGWLLQQGAATDPMPWLLGLPLLLSIAPAIMLAGVPDRAADGAAGKRTLAVRLAPPVFVRATQALALSALLVAAATWPLLFGSTSAVLSGLLAAALHGGALVLVVQARCGAKAARPLRAQAQRLDGVLVIALSYILWFVLVPLLALPAPG